VQINELALETSDGPMAAYEAVPDGGARRAVVVIQEAFGVNDHIQDVTRRFADAGYHAIAPALFHRAGGGTAPYDDFEKVLPLYEGLTDAGILVDAGAAADHLNAAGFLDGAIGIVGFCMGGRVTFLVSLDRALGAAVGFYGGGIVTARFPTFPALIDRVGELQTPWLGLFGDEDHSIPVADVERLRQELDGADVPHDIVRYAGADHGFHCDQRPSYHAESATDAWARTIAWFEAHLQTRD
jgi:carboxymethylenebutenolidase